LQIDTDLLLKTASAADELSPVVPPSMTLNDLEPPKYEFLGNFSRFQAAIHISRVNCAVITGNRPRQPANEVSSIKNILTVQVSTR